jgi:hypothetical protein
MFMWLQDETRCIFVEAGQKYVVVFMSGTELMREAGRWIKNKGVL